MRSQAISEAGDCLKGHWVPRDRRDRAWFYHCSSHLPSSTAALLYLAHGFQFCTLTRRDAKPSGNTTVPASSEDRGFHSLVCYVFNVTTSPCQEAGKSAPQIHSREQTHVLQIGESLIKVLGSTSCVKLRTSSQLRSPTLCIDHALPAVR